MLEVKQLPRVFLFNNNSKELKLTDPDPSMNSDDVLNFYSTLYPVLTTAKVEGPRIEDDEVQFKFLTTIGTKG